MQGLPDSYGSVQEMLLARQPTEPVYCVYPDRYRETARHFLEGFPGRVLYAVKANNHPEIIRLLYQAGVRHFDCASLPEVRLVRSNCPDASCYFMIPVGLRGAARAAYEECGVRHFMIDHPDRLDVLEDELRMSDCVVFARMAVSHESAFADLSSKFGAHPDEIPGLLTRIRDRGAEPALAFNVGTMVTSPDAYRHALDVAAGVLHQLDFRVRLVDIGGGFPKSYPDFPAPEVDDFFRAVRRTAGSLPLRDGGELLVEPGRALAAPGLSAVVEILLRKDDRLYLIDGMCGIFWELRFEAHKSYPVRAYRNGESMTGSGQSFQLYGPTCDSSDVLPGRVDLPEEVATGDYLEFSNIGAYSLSGRTDFNGHFSEQLVLIEGSGQASED